MDRRNQVLFLKDSNYFASRLVTLLAYTSSWLKLFFLVFCFFLKGRNVLILPRDGSMKLLKKR